MFPYCSDYTWRDGLPYPNDHVSLAGQAVCYRVVHDPYHKRVSLERYQNGQFDAVGYDSALLDFRQLGETQQALWRAEDGLVRDENDRVILRESYDFEGDRCRQCVMCSPQGIPVAVQKIYYEDLGDAFSGVILYDPWDRPVLLKRYRLSSDAQFGELLEERWMMDGVTDGHSEGR